MIFRDPIVPGIEFWQRYEHVLDKLEKNRRDVDRHWKQLRRRLIDYEEKQEQREEKTGRDDAPELKEAAGQ